MRIRISDAVDVNETYAIQGTSMNSAKLILETGVMNDIPFREADPFKTHYGDIYMYPNERYFRDKIFDDGTKIDFATKDWNYMLEASKAYAHDCEIVQRFYTRYGFIPEDVLELSFYDSMSQKDLMMRNTRIHRFLVPELKSHGLDIEDILGFEKRVHDMKGVILCFNSRLIELDPKRGEEEDVEIKIYSPKGLQAKYISAIVPLGNIEKQFLMKI